MNPLSRYLDTVGDGTGTKQATGDYSVTPQDFKIVGERYIMKRIHRLIVAIEDTNGSTVQEYGNLGAALTNGITLTYTRNGDSIDLTDGLPIKSNGDWGRLCYDVAHQDWGAGNEVILVRFSFDKFYDRGLILDTPNCSLVANCNDNLTGLVSHLFMVQGED